MDYRQNEVVRDFFYINHLKYYQHVL